MVSPLKILLVLWLLSQALAARPVQVEILEGSLSQSEAHQVESFLDWISEAYCRCGLDPTSLVRVRIFSNFRDFQVYQRSHRSPQDGSPMSFTGYYSTAGNEVVLWRSRRFLAVFVHEAQHALLRSTLKNPPKWLNEGLSECFEGLTLTESGILLEPQEPRIRKLGRYFDAEFSQKAVALLGMRRADFNTGARSQELDSYTLAWALVYYLWQRPDGQALLSGIFSDLRHGLSSTRSLQARYPGGLQALTSDLQSYYEALFSNSLRK